MIMGANLLCNSFGSHFLYYDEFGIVDGGITCL